MSRSGRQMPRRSPRIASTNERFRSGRQMPKQGPRRTTSSGSILALEPLAITMIKKPAGFLSLPRELRDQVYAYLLSTEYNRYGEDPPPLDTLRYDYAYRFHNSIFSTNRQLRNEAFQAFYMNLLVHISLSKDQVAHLMIDRFDSMILRDANVPPNELHAMRIDLSSNGDVSSDYGRKYYTVTYKELPQLCRSLLRVGVRSPGRLASTKLRLIIDDKAGIDGDTIREDKPTESHGAIVGYLARGDPDIGGNPDGKENTIGTTSSRVRKLLEPLRRLHSINDTQIFGPLSGEYKATIIADISKSPPGTENLLRYVLMSLEKAIGEFDSGDFASSTRSFIDTLDELHDAKLQGINDTDIKLINGPYAGSTFHDACDAISFTVRTKLCWAYLKAGDINTANRSLFRIVRPCACGEHIIRLRGHDAIMLSYLESQIRQEWYRLGKDKYGFRCYYLVGKLLEQTLRREPENRLLVQEIEKRKAVVAKNDELKTFMVWADRNSWALYNEDS